MANNKVKYGLKNCYYAVAIIDELTNTATYKTPKPWKGAVNLSFEQQGDTTKFRADNIDYWVGNSNNGYQGDLETALIPDSFREDVLAEYRDGNGILVEDAGAKTVHFAFMFQFEGDVKNTRHVFYNCTANRPSVAGQTTEETIEPQTETVTLTAVAIHNAAYDKDIVKGRALEGDAPYDDWFNAVYQPTADGVVTPETTAVASDAVLFGYTVSDLQTNLVVNDDYITGTLHKQTSGDLVDRWGEGYFMAIQFADISASATSVLVGMDPSESSGLVELIGDPDLNGVFKVTDKDKQKFKVVITNGTYTQTSTYDLSELVLAE